MMARETWLNADEAIEQGFADSKMFENDNMQIVASNTQVLSKDVLNRVTALVSKTPEVNIDIDAIANKVIEKINMKERNQKSMLQIVKYQQMDFQDSFLIQK